MRHHPERRDTSPLVSSWDERDNGLKSRRELPARTPALTRCLVTPISFFALSRFFRPRPVGAVRYHARFPCDPIPLYPRQLLPPHVPSYLPRVARPSL